MAHNNGNFSVAIIPDGCDYGFSALIGSGTHNYVKPGWGVRWSAGARVSCSRYGTGVRRRGAGDVLSYFQPNDQGIFSWLSLLEAILFKRPAGLESADVE
jgi:hypothetical protein